MSAGALGASVLLALMLSAQPARADDETRLLPPAISLSDSSPTARIGHAWVPAASLRVAYGWRNHQGTNKAHYSDAQIGLGFGLYHRVEIASFLSARYPDASLRQPLVLDPLQLQVKVALRVVADEGPGSGVALYAGARLPLPLKDAAPEDPRAGVRFGFTGDERLPFGLRISMFAGSELRFAGGERRFTAYADLGLGFSLDLWRRIGLKIFATGNARMSLTELPASSVNFPVTGRLGCSARVARGVNLEIGVYYDHTRPAIGDDARDGIGFGGYVLLTYERKDERAKNDSPPNEFENAEARPPPIRPVPPMSKNLLATPGPGGTAIDLAQAASDAEAAIERANRLYLGPALAQRGMEALAETIRGFAMGAFVAGVLIAATNYWRLSMVLTEKFLLWLGVITLSEFAAERSKVIGAAFNQFLGTIAIARGDPALIDRAARQYADAIALITGATGEALIFVAAAKGIDPVLKKLEGSQLYERLGATRLRAWLAGGVRRLDGQPKTTTKAKPDINNARKGRQYDELHKFSYQRQQVIVEGPNGKRYILDSYQPGQIVSRKFTQLARVSRRTALRYVRELPKKYRPQTRIADVPSNGPYRGQRLVGQMFLEVPIQLEPVPRWLIDAADDLGVTIRDVTGKEYR